MNRRRFVLALSGAGLGGLGVTGAVLSACTTTHTMPDDPGDACDMFQHQNGWWRAVRASEQRCGASPALQLAIIRQESGFRYRARPPEKHVLWIIPAGRVTTAHGYSQALNQTWDQYKRARGDDGVDRTEFSDATDFVAWFVSRSKSELGIPYSDARSHYLAYHEGRGGYARGSYRGDAALMSSARRVQGYYDTYAGQLARCQGELSRGWLPF